MLLGLGTVEFCNNVGVAFGLKNDHDWTVVVSLSLPVQRFFDARVPDEDESTRLMVKVDDMTSVLSFELLDVLKGGLHNDFTHLLNVLGTFLLLTVSCMQLVYSIISPTHTSSKTQTHYPSPLQYQPGHRPNLQPTLRAQASPTLP